MSVTAAVPPRRARWRGRGSRKYSGALVGAFVILGLLVTSVVVPLPFDPTTPDATASLRPPNSVHLFGTDQNGLDIFSRTIAAAKSDLSVALIGCALACVLGVPLGIAASSPGRTASVLMRVLDVLQAFPLLILALTIAGLAAGHEFRNLVVAIVVVNTPLFVRLVRAEALVVRSQRYIEAAEAIGANPWRIAVRHVLPNVTGVIAAQFSLSAGFAVVIIAALGFLGVGISPPTPDWGQMVQTGVQYLSTGQWWMALCPSAAIVAAVLSFNAVSDGLYLLSSPERRRR